MQRKKKSPRAVNLADRLTARGDFFPLKISVAIKLTICFPELLLEEAVSESQIAKWTVYFGESWCMNVMICWPVGDFLNSVQADSVHCFPKGLQSSGQELSCHKTLVIIIVGKQMSIKEEISRESYFCVSIMIYH